MSQRQVALYRDVVNIIGEPPRTPAIPMTPATLLRYLFGQRSAIQQVAEDPRSLWIGLAFVMSAAFAREYDREDLLNEPWHLAIPLVASLAASLAIFAALWFELGNPSSPIGYWDRYRTFLSLFWMTAPLAWLYAIPYEQFLDPIDALRANLWTLALVALWRVVLLIRAVQVWLKLDWRAAPVVLLCADALAMAAVMFLPWPIIEVMGGMKPPADSHILGRAKILVLVVGVPSFLVLFGLSTYWRPALGPDEPEASAPSTRRPVWSLAVLAALAIAAGCAVLPWTQPPQQLRRQVERTMAGGEVHEALVILSAHPRESFPPDWNVPPVWVPGEPRGPFLDAVEASQAGEGPGWAREVYLARFTNYLTSYAFVYGAEDETLVRMARVVARTPEVLAPHANPAFMSAFEMREAAAARARAVRADGVEGPESVRPETPRPE